MDHHNDVDNHNDENAAAGAASSTVRSLNRSHGSFELVVSPLLLALLGLWLDRTVGTTPLFTVIAAVTGVLGAAIKIYFGYRLEMSAHDAAGPWSRPAAGGAT